MRTLVASSVNAIPQSSAPCATRSCLAPWHPFCHWTYVAWAPPPVVSHEWPWLMLIWQSYGWPTLVKPPKASTLDSILTNMLMTLSWKDMNSSCGTDWTCEPSPPSRRSWIYSLKSTKPFSMPCSIKSTPSLVSAMASSTLASLACMLAMTSQDLSFLPLPCAVGSISLPRWSSTCFLYYARFVAALWYHFSWT